MVSLIRQGADLHRIWQLWFKPSGFGRPWLQMANEPLDEQTEREMQAAMEAIFARRFP